jgi:hypothetical protein
MKRLFTLLWMVCLINESGMARAGSLDLYPWIPEMKPAPVESDTSFLLALSSRSSSHSATTDDPSDEATYSFEGDRWIRAYGGYDYAFLGALINGVKAYVPYFAGQGGNNLGSSTGHSGYSFGLDLGQQLDRDDALFMKVEYVESQQQQFTGTDTGDENVLNFDPSLLSGSLNFERTLLRSKGARTYVTLGGGYYHCMVHVNQDSSGSNPNSIDAVFTGDILGGTVGVGQEFALGPGVGLELSALFRAANFSQVDADTVNITANSSVGSQGPFTLYTGPVVHNTITVGPNNLGPIAGASILPIDYSGFDGHANLRVYF